MIRAASILIPAIACLFFSCDQTVRFEQPQPVDKGDIASLPGKFMGQFYSDSDSTSLDITPGHITISRFEYIRFSKNQLDSSAVFKGDTLIDMASGYRTIARINGDSLEALLPVWIDTLLARGDQYHLRRYRGHFFCNALGADGYWTVRVLAPRSVNVIAVEELRAPEDIEQLREITPVQDIRQDSLADPKYLVNPKRKELRELMQRGFTTRAVYKRVK